jgi:hypothetical protein
MQKVNQLQEHDSDQSKYQQKLCCKHRTILPESTLETPYLIKYNLLLIPLEPSTLALLHTNRNNCSHQLKHAELHITRYIFYSSHITGRKIEKSLAKPHMKVEHRITTAMAMVPKRI